MNPKVTCAYCGRDLTDTQNSEGFRLMLRDERIPIHDYSMPVTDVAHYRNLDGPKHFCDVDCLARWTRREFE